MFYKFLVRKAGNVLITSGLVLALSTSAFAQADQVETEPTSAVDAVTGSRHLFLPLVQSSVEGATLSEPTDASVEGVAPMLDPEVVTEEVAPMLDTAMVAESAMEQSEAFNNHYFLPLVQGDTEAELNAAFSANWSYWWGDTKTSATDIGTSVGRTCFLTSIGGHLRPGGAYLYSGYAYPAQAGVRKKSNGNYELFVQPEKGRHLFAAARCVNTAVGRTEVNWSTYEQSTYGDKVIGATTSKRQCFLQAVKNFAVPLKDNTGAIYSYSWAFDDKQHPDAVQVSNDGSYWKFSIKQGVHPYPVNIQATAVCLNANEFHGIWFWQVGDPGTAQFNLTNVSGATCGVTGIKGHFDANLGDWGDGVNITTVGSQFKLNLANGKGSSAICMK